MNKKRCISLLLIAVLTISLMACGNNNGTNENNNGGGNNQTAKQNVYSYEEIEAIDFSGKNENIDVQKMTYKDGKIYILANIYSRGNIELFKEGAAEEVAVADTADIAIEEPMFEYTDTLNLFSFTLGESEVTRVELKTEPKEGENSWINALELGPNGNVYGIQYVTKEDYSDPENYVYEERQVLVCWNGEDGSLLWEKELDELKGENDYYSVNSLLIPEDGKLYMSVYAAESYSICGLDSDGNILFVTPMNNLGIEYINQITMKANGNILITGNGEDWYKTYVCEFNTNTGEFGEKQEFPINMNNYSYCGGKTTDYILMDSIGVYTYNIGDEEVTPIMDYINSDIAINYMRYAEMIDGEHFIGVYTDSVDYTTKIAMFTKVNPEDIPDKEVITLGVYYLDDTIKRQVIDFNKNNTQNRIVIRNYYSYSTSEDYMAGYTKLNNDIIAGDMPDILLSDNNMPIDNYIAKGLIADVGSLLEQDEELSQYEYMENVFRAYSTNDTLYYIVPSFQVGTAIGKKSIFGDREGITMSELQALADSQPEGTSIFGEVNMNRWSFFYSLIQYCGSDFIDLDTGKCYFNSQEFIDVLEFAKTLPMEIEYGYDDSDFWMRQENQYREGHTLLMPTTIYEIPNLVTQIYGYFGEDVNFVGFPNENRDGSIIIAGSSYVISSKTKNMDGAWEFVRYYLTDEYQRNIPWGGMPVKKDVFLEKAEEATQKPYYLDENGEKVESEYSWYINGEEIILDPLTKEQLNEIIAYIETVDRKMYYDESIWNIIDEESAAFFSGQKTAEAVVDIIQSRAQIYVNENR